MQMKSRTRVPKIYYVVICVLMLMAMTVVAYGDTYNFYFDKPKKSERTTPEAESEPGSEVKSEERVAQREPVQSEKQAVSESPQGSPIIINNSVNVPVNQTTQEAPGGGGAPVSTASHSPPVERRRRPSWSVGISAGAAFLPQVALNDPFIHPFGDEPWVINEVVDLRPQGLVSLDVGYRLTDTWRLRSLIGIIDYHSTGPAPLLGMDLEAIPLRLDLGSFDLIELGALIGGSTAFSVNGNLGSFYYGLRMNVNFGQHFTLTAAARMNQGSTTMDTGIALNF